MGRKPRLLDEVRARMMLQHKAPATQQAYCGWIRRFILFHQKAHPKDLGVPEIERFLEHLATHDKVSAPTQNQAFNALIFLYREVLEIEFESPINALRARARKRLPIVLTGGEAGAILSHIPGKTRLMVELLLGSGIRAAECVHLRVKDADLARARLRVYDSKSRRDRETILPRCLLPKLARQVEAVRRLHDDDLAAGDGSVILPGAFARKTPSAAQHPAWQFLFPTRKEYPNPLTGKAGRGHVRKDILNTAIARAAREAGVHKRVTAHTFRHTFATLLLENGTDIRKIQTLLGHSSLQTTMIYTHVARTALHGITSPLDLIHPAPDPPQKTNQPDVDDPKLPT